MGYIGTHLLTFDLNFLEHPSTIPESNVEPLILRKGSSTPTTGIFRGELAVCVREGIAVC